MIYLDSAATTLEKPASVSRAVANAIRTCASPGRGGYPASMKAGKILYQCRELAAELFGAQDPEQVVLTNSATHGLNIAIRSLVQPGATVLISGYEHNAVTRVLHSIPDVEIRVAESPVFESKHCFQAFDNLLTPDIDVVICNHVSNVFGFIQPIEQIAKLCRERGKPLIIDASQSAGILPISMKELGAAFIAMPGHKGLYGPQGTGLLICGTVPEPILFGGTGGMSSRQDMPDFLPDRLEAGTHNVCGAAGLLAGMKFLKKQGIQRIRNHEQKLCRQMAYRLRQIPNARTFYGSDQSGVLSFSLDDMDCELVGDLLARRGIAVRTGLHCAPLAHKTVGTLDQGTIRISFSVFNDPGQICRTADTIQEISKRRRAL